MHLFFLQPMTVPSWLHFNSTLFIEVSSKRQYAKKARRRIGRGLKNEGGGPESWMKNTGGGKIYNMNM